MESPWEGRLIRLRAHEPEDEPLLHRWFNDPEVTDNINTRYPVSHQFEREFLQRKDSVGYHDAGFAVETLADKRLIGRVGLHQAAPENRSASLGIVIGDKSFWDGGYGTDAMRVVCRFGFEMMNLHRIALEVFTQNARAAHVYEKVGFRLDGCRRKAIYRNGEYRDVLFMSLLEGELRLD